MTRLISLSITVILALISGCDVGVYGTHNSSQGDNDYFEEPISGSSKKYAPALETSNRFIESFAGGQLETALEILDPRLQEAISVEGFEEMHQKILDDFGPMVEFKPMQWGFSRNSQLENIVVSVKIVIHDKGQTFYILNFADDDSYQRIIGFKIVPRVNNERVMQGANRAPGLN